MLEKSEKEGGLTFDELTSNGSTLILGGSETTATLLSGCIFQLLKNPDVMKRILAEIRGNFTSADDIDMFSIAHLKYTLAVLDETMRIYPPTPNQHPREAPPGGDTIGEDVIPEGTTLYISQYVMCHLDSYWAKPEEFHPERFLKDDETTFEQFKNDDHTVFQPFSAGSRNCIGRNLAYAEMRLILTRLLYDFDLELDERSTDWMKGQKAYVLWEKPPLWVKVAPRAKA